MNSSVFLLRRMLVFVAWGFGILSLQAAEVGTFTTAGRDAEEYSATALRHDVLLLKINLGRATAADNAELDRLRAHGEAIRAKYAVATPAARTEYDRRVKELSASRVAPGVRVAVAESFPSVAEVTTAYPDELQRAAALQILAAKLKERAGPPLAPEGAAKVALYEAAWTAINPKSRADYTSRLDASDAFRRDQRFNAEVLGRFMPIYAGDAVAAVQKSDHKSRLAQMRRTILVANCIVAIVTLSIPLLLLLRGQYQRAEGYTGDIELPATLQRVRLWKLSYPVHLRCGRVRSAERVNFTETTTHVQPDRYNPDSWVQTETRTSTTRNRHYYNYTVETMEGRTFDFSHDYSIAEAGQLVSLLQCRDRLLLTYNHSTGVFLTGALAKQHSLSGGVLWFFAMVVAAAGFYAVQRFLLPDDLVNDDVFAKHRIQMWTFLAAPIVALYILPIKLMVQKRREREFDTKWEPKFREYLQSITGTLERGVR